MSSVGQQRVWAYEERLAGQAGCSTSAPCCSGRALSNAHRKNAAKAGRRTGYCSPLVQSVGGSRQSLICSVVQEQKQVSFHRCIASGMRLGHTAIPEIFFHLCRPQQMLNGTFPGQRAPSVPRKRACQSVGTGSAARSPYPPVTF